MILKPLSVFKTRLALLRCYMDFFILWRSAQELGHEWLDYQLLDWRSRIQLYDWTRPDIFPDGKVPVMSFLEFESWFNVSRMNFDLD